MTRFRQLLAALLIPLLLAVTAVSAQSPVDWDAWEALARRAENVVEAGSLPDEDLQSLRTQVAEWRARLLDGQKVNSTRIATLREQISALGPAPAEGDTEAEDVAKRRKELTDELASQQAPALRAVEAWGRADSIVAQIDRSLRARQANTLRRHTPSPLRPSSWKAAVDATVAVGTKFADAVRIKSESLGRGGLLSRLPVVAALLIMAVLLLTRGWRWVDTAPERLAARASAASQTVLTFLLSFAQIVIPAAGVALIVLAANASGLTGDWGRLLLHSVPLAGLVVFTGRWIVRQMFPEEAARRAPLQLPQLQRKIARRQGTWLSIFLALHLLLLRSGVPLSGFRTATDETRLLPVDISEAAAGVWHLPLAVGAALALFRLGSILRRAPRFAATAEAPPYRVAIASWLGQLSRLVAIAAPLAIAAGFVSAGHAALWPMVMTLGLTALVLLLQQFIADVWALLNRGDEKARDALAPVLIGFALVILSLPFLALIWGARVSELAEVWTRVGQGISLGGVRLSPGAIVTFLVIFTLGYLLTRAVQGGLRTSILPKTKIDSGAQTAIVSGLGYLGIFLAALMAVVAAGIDLSSLAIVAGALSVGIGFGLQNIVSNFVSGIILLIERPVAVGDWIRVGQSEGYVRRISVRSTMIQTFDRNNIIVPNSDLITKEVTNWTRGSLTGRIIVPVSVAYGSDTRKVEALLNEIAEAQPTALIDPAPLILFSGLGPDGMNFEMRLVLADVNASVTVASEIRHQVIERFAAEGIEVPFPQLDIWHRSPPGEQPAVAILQPPRGAQPREAAGANRQAVESDTDLDPRIARSTGSGMESSSSDGGHSGGDGDGDGGDR